MLEKAYDPKSTEDRIYEMWEQSGAFRAEASSTKDSFTISMPPPNATGQLHLGHAVMLAIEDIFVRYARMRGKEALWVPGTDHAAIATESVVIKKIQAEEKIADPRAKLGREELLKRIAAFVEKSRGTIRSQVRKMGSSCDWSRERYTMDPILNRCVNEVFVKMSKDGLIYRGHRIVNWDPKMQTTVSDDEIEYREEKAPFYTFQYGPFQIGTSRPETKFGDKYVVMHPEDERYVQYKHGDTFEAEWINGKVSATVIKDKAVDPAFGTGVMTITPWHDMIDFEIAERHDLKKEQVIGYDGKLLAIAGEFEGLKIADARPKVVEKLQEKGLLVSIKEDYVHNVATSYRGGGTIEPQIKEQWFIDVNKAVVPWKRREMSLKQILQEVIRNGDIKIVPAHFEKTYFAWIDNLKDWCISRQIWWGHRVPVWYREDRGSLETYVGVRAPDGAGWDQDPDTLDTWFSAALWTWSTLIDPELHDDFELSLEDLLKQSPDFQKFHPTQVMETGYDILFFWVARMILMTTYATGQVPFETVYLHGLIRTREGKKMSKSHPETMIDPLDIIPTYGADALRLSMIVGQSPGADARLYEEKIAGYRNFINKLWNASRFVLMQCEQAKVEPSDVLFSEADRGSLSFADRALLGRLNQVIERTTKGLEEYRLSETGEELYSFVWNFYCDWYLELSKGPSSGSGGAEANLDVLVHALRTILILLHPYCPFVTEELWAQVKHKDAGLLIKEPWPHGDLADADAEAARAFDLLTEVITSIRQMRSEQNVEAGKDVTVTLSSHAFGVFLESQEAHIRRLAKVGSLTIITGPFQPDADTVSAFLAGVEVHLSLAGLVDKEKERENLQKEQKELSGYVKGVQAKLGNEGFVSRAPAEVIEGEREKLKVAEEKLAKIEERLGNI